MDCFKIEHFALKFGHGARRRGFVSVPWTKDPYFSLQQCEVEIGSQSMDLFFRLGARIKMAVSGAGRPQENSGEETGIQIQDRVDTPRMYRVMLLNDDYTPMDFVVLVLKRFFGKSDVEAQKVMLDVHEKGSGVAGVYTLEMAEMKVMQTNQFAQIHEHPLKSILEAEE